MPCFFPLEAWKAEGLTDNGKARIVFKRSEAYFPAAIALPCGRCVGCKLERSRQWAVRCLHEASLYERNCFLTLTLAKMPKSGSLDVRVFQLFMKRLRKKFFSDRIRFFHCGEYGELCVDCGKSRLKCSCKIFVPMIGRPHYHALLFNFDFEDKVLLKTQHDNPLFVSKTLDSVWGLGRAVIGAVSFESAAYVARYCMKKITGDKAGPHYEGRKPEYITMSRGGNVRGSGGIGAAWFHKWKGDVFPSDSVVVRGLEMSPPRYYADLYELEDPEGLRLVKARRDARARLVPLAQRRDRRDPMRAYVREKVKLAQIVSLSRNLGEDK